MDVGRSEKQNANIDVTVETFAEMCAYATGGLNEERYNVYQTNPMALVERPTLEDLGLIFYGYQEYLTLREKNGN